MDLVCICVVDNVLSVLFDSNLSSRHMFFPFCYLHTIFRRRSSHSGLVASVPSLARAGYCLPAALFLEKPLCPGELSRRS